VGGGVWWVGCVGGASFKERVEEKGGYVIGKPGPDRRRRTTLPDQRRGLIKGEKRILLAFYLAISGKGLVHDLVERKYGGKGKVGVREIAAGLAFQRNIMFLGKSRTRSGGGDNTAVYY